MNYCYTFNCTVKLDKGIEKYGTYEIEPYFERDGVRVSSLCDAGWSGFPKSAEFYRGSQRSVVCEICVQPEVPLCNKDILKFAIRTVEGSEFKDTLLLKNVWKKAKRGAGIHRAKEEFKVSSVNGAVYSITPKSVSYEEHYNSSEKSNLDKDNYFDIDYLVRAHRPPRNKSNVMNIQGLGKGSTITCRAVIGLQVQDDGTILYNRNSKAVRKRYSDYNDLYQYVTEGSLLRFGYQSMVTTNRIAPDGVNPMVQKVRLRIEFPEEMEARSLKQKLKFKGRYLVYELPVTQRKLGKYFNR